MLNELKRIRILMGLNESIQDNIYYHGTSQKLPFTTFDSSMVGTGFVAMGSKFPGFFFTSEMKNAEYYSEYFVAKVKIDNIKPNPYNQKHPPTILDKAYNDGNNYLIDDYLDGAYYSDIVVVPKQNLSDIQILEWIFIGDKEDIFNVWDEFFGGEEDEEYGGYYVNHDIILSLLKIIEVDIDMLLSIDVFKEYWDSKEYN
jgi:hypothetical protein